MRMEFPGRYLLLLAFIASVLRVGTAQAELGAGSASIVADSTEMQGSVQVYSSPQYEIQEITNPNGIRVREFVNRDGVVFAVAWNGPAEPDLQQLLGVHFAQYHQARMTQSPSALRGDLRLVLPDLVIESGGHMRAFRGRAYLPALVPAGASIAALK